MADKVNYLIEKNIPELYELVKHSIFELSEVKQIITNRKNHEYKLQNKNAQIHHFIEAIDFELYWDSKRKASKEKAGYSKRLNSDYTFANRIISLFNRLLSKFPGNYEIYSKYIGFLAKIKAYHRISTLLGSILQKFPNNPSLWKLVAYTEYSIQGNEKNARLLFHQSIKSNPSNIECWLNYFQFELDFLSKIIKRKKLLLEDQVKQNITTKIDDKAPKDLKKINIEIFKIIVEECIKDLHFKNQLNSNYKKNILEFLAKSLLLSQNYKNNVDVENLVEYFQEKIKNISLEYNSLRAYKIIFEELNNQNFSDHSKILRIIDEYQKLEKDVSEHFQFKIKKQIFKILFKAESLGIKIEDNFKDEIINALIYKIEKLDQLSPAYKEQLPCIIKIIKIVLNLRISEYQLKKLQLVKFNDFNIEELFVKSKIKLLLNQSTIQDLKDLEKLLILNTNLNNEKISEISELLYNHLLNLNKLNKFSSENIFKYLLKLIQNQIHTSSKVKILLNYLIRVIEICGYSKEKFMQIKNLNIHLNDNNYLDLISICTLTPRNSDQIAFLMEDYVCGLHSLNSFKSLNLLYIQQKKFEEAKLLVEKSKKFLSQQEFEILMKQYRLTIEKY